MSKPPKIDRQREHQANERTFLAWLRTSIALIGFGFAITRFGIFVRQLEVSLTPKATRSESLLSSENLGIVLVAFGIVVIAAALWNHNCSYRQIERGDYRPNRLMIWITSLVVMGLGILCLIFIIVRSPSQSPLPPNRHSISICRFNICKAIASYAHKIAKTTLMANLV